jgi:uncharacterized paraquat-inducible protein A
MDKKEKELKCDVCDYKWIPRLKNKNPKECPRCKGRLDKKPKRKRFF